MSNKKINLKVTGMTTVIVLVAAVISVFTGINLSGSHRDQTAVLESSVTVLADNEKSTVSEKANLSQDKWMDRSDDMSSNVSETSAAEKHTYTMSDIANLDNTQNFSDGALEHIFDGTINKQGKATGYHYTMVSDSKGKMIEKTRSAVDQHGVFTGNVEVNGIKKNNFSSFYPENWSPQEVVDAINIAYDDAIANPDNPSGSLWIGYYNDLEIDMYLTDDQKIITAYPIYEGA